MLGHTTRTVDSIAFTVPKGKDTGVDIIINGREFIEILRDIELSFATREGHPRIAGAYSSLPAHRVFFPSRHFLGEPEPSYSDGAGRTYVLECECGEPGCWPLAVRIEVREREVVWSDFQQPHRGPQSKAGEWRYDALLSFTFDRQLYEQALSAQKRVA
jgi:hypothetical protein